MVKRYILMLLATVICIGSLLAFRSDAQEQVVSQTQEKQVGVFYFLWHGVKSAAGPFDVSKIKEKDPAAHLSNNAWLLAGGGAVGMSHWWGESLFGYYRAGDRWVMEKDVQMLTDAQVDFLALDYSNGTAYPNQVLTMLEVLDKYYRQGYDVPQLTFITKADSGMMVMGLYETFYLGYPQYSHLWYQVEGKPLMVGVESSEALSEECKAYFTWRHPQWPRESYQNNGFPWIDFDEDGDGKQTVYNWSDGSTIMSVSVAQHSGTLAFSSSALYGDDTNHTRSWHNGANDKGEDAWKYGYNFAQQFENAIESDVDTVFITGWNEWIASRQASGMWNDMEGNPINDPIILVDNCDINNSRDIQPMKGGYGDNYYLLMTDYIAEFKNSSKVEHLQAVQQEDVSVYQDYEADTEDRAHKGYGTLYYTDTTGRNDFTRLKMTNDSKYLYAYAKTAEPIAGMGQAHCMTLFLSTGGETNWCGYDYVIGRTAAADGAVEVERRTLNGWEAVGSAKYILQDNQLQIMIPMSLLGMSSQQAYTLEFKWADNYQGEDDIYAFYLNGDSAPYGRENYSYSSVIVQPAKPKVQLKEVALWGIRSGNEQPGTAAGIAAAQIIGQWADSRENAHDIGPEFAYDKNAETRWNPQAKDYASGEGILYTLDGLYDITQLNFQFAARQQYFTVSVSSDGQTYTQPVQVTAENAGQYYTGYLCKLPLEAQNVKYIKLEFTGSGDKQKWINFYEFTVIGKQNVI